MLLLLFILFISFNFSQNKSYASTLMLQNHTFSKKIQVLYPHIQNPQLCCSIRDISTKETLQWKMDQTIIITNKTEDILIFTFDYDWPNQSLQYIVIDYLIMEKTPNIISFKINVTSFQTHLVRNDMDVNNPSILLSYPLGFTDFKLTSRFTYIIVIQEMYNMYAIHYMQNNHMHNGMEFQGMGHWVQFNIVLVRPQILQECQKCVYVQRRWQINQFVYTKPDVYPYFLGLRSISANKSQGRFYQDDKIISFISQNDEKYGITMFPFSNLDFIDERQYFYKYVAKINKIDQIDQLDQIAIIKVEQNNNFQIKTYFFISFIITLVLTLIVVIIYHYLQKSKNNDLQQEPRIQSTHQIEIQNKNCVICNKHIEITSIIDDKNIKVCDKCQHKDITTQTDIH